MTYFSEDQITASLAKRLDTLGVARYEAVGAYAEVAELPAVIFGELPEHPDTAVSVVIYNDARDRDDFNPDLFVRLRFRAPAENPLGVGAMADRVFDALHVPDHQYRPDVWPDGIRVLDTRRVVRGQSVPDSNSRYVRADSYRITLNPGE